MRKQNSALLTAADVCPVNGAFIAFIWLWEDKT
jgi:hypothetical protein